MVLVNEVNETSKHVPINSLSRERIATEYHIGVLSSVPHYDLNGYCVRTL
jgi:hypothetical protein